MNSTPDSPTPPPTSSNDNGPQVMEIRPNSRQENSTGMRVPLLPITQEAILEHYVLTWAIDHWLRPKYETYKAKSASLQTFVIHDRPHMLDLPTNALSEAGFFFTG